MQYEVIAAIIDVLRCYHEVVRVGIVPHISTRDRLHEGGRDDHVRSDGNPISRGIEPYIGRRAGIVCKYEVKY